jgi:hypothetical protein
MWAGCSVTYLPGGSLGGGLHPAAASAEVSYQGPHVGDPSTDPFLLTTPSFAELLSYYPGQGSLAFAFIDDELSHHCSGVTGIIGFNPGSTIVGGVSASAAPRIGDDSAAWQTGDPMPRSTLRQDILCVRKGDTLLISVYGGPATGIDTEAEILTKTAADKVH